MLRKLHRASEEVYRGGGTGSSSRGRSGTCSDHLESIWIQPDLHQISCSEGSGLKRRPPSLDQMTTDPDGHEETFTVGPGPQEQLHTNKHNCDWTSCEDHISLAFS